MRKTQSENDLLIPCERKKLDLLCDKENKIDVFLVNKNGIMQLEKIDKKLLRRKRKKKNGELN